MTRGAKGVIRSLFVGFAAIALGACASTQPMRAPEQPALAALAMPYAPDLRALEPRLRLPRRWRAGASRKPRGIIVPYPRDVPPVAFELEIGEGGVRAAADTFDAERDSRVLAALMPAVFRETASNNTIQWWRANPWR